MFHVTVRASLTKNRGLRGEARYVTMLNISGNVFVVILPTLEEVVCQWRNYHAA